MVNAHGSLLQKGERKTRNQTLLLEFKVCKMLQENSYHSVYGMDSNGESLVVVSISDGQACISD